MDRRTDEVQNLMWPPRDLCIIIKEKLFCNQN